MQQDETCDQNASNSIIFYGSWEFGMADDVKHPGFIQCISMAVEQDSWSSLSARVDVWVKGSPQNHFSEPQAEILEETTHTQTHTLEKSRASPEPIGELISTFSFMNYAHSELLIDSSCCAEHCVRLPWVWKTH